MTQSRTFLMLLSLLFHPSFCVIFYIRIEIGIKVSRTLTRIAMPSSGFRTVSQASDASLTDFFNLDSVPYLTHGPCMFQVAAGMKEGSGALQIVLTLRQHVRMELDIFRL